MELITEVKTNCLHDAMKANERVIVTAALIHNLITRWGDVSFTPRQLYVQKIIPSAHYVRGWMGSRAGLDNLVLILCNGTELSVFSNTSSLT
jgi:hypothetical protein